MDLTACGTRALAALALAGIAVGIVGLASGVPVHADPDAYSVPEPTTTGDWSGSWSFDSRDFQYALFFREADGGVEAQVYFRNKARVEGFRTDWSGAAEYKIGDRPASFRIEFDERGPDRLTGRWFWESPRFEGKRTEDAEFEMYRTLDGRQLAVHFTRFERTDFLEGRPPYSRDLPAVWVFRKVSKRVVRSEELPF